MSRPLMWRLAGCAAGVAAFFFMPLSIAFTWLARRANDFQNHSEMQALRTRALRRASLQRHKRTQR